MGTHELSSKLGIAADKFAESASAADIGKQHTNDLVTFFNQTAQQLEDMLGFPLTDTETELTNKYDAMSTAFQEGNQALVEAAGRDRGASRRSLFDTIQNNDAIVRGLTEPEGMPVIAKAELHKSIEAIGVGILALQEHIKGVKNYAEALGVSFNVTYSAGMEAANTAAEIRDKLQ